MREHCSHQVALSNEPSLLTLHGIIVEVRRLQHSAHVMFTTSGTRRRQDYCHFMRVKLASIVMYSEEKAWLRGFATSLDGMEQNVVDKLDANMRAF